MLYENRIWKTGDTRITHCALNKNDGSKLLRANALKEAIIDGDAVSNVNL